MNAFTIKDLENLSGIKAHTIRIWEQRYSFLKPQRTQTNIRYYNKDELKAILDIALLNKYGYKISIIDKMNAAEVQQKIGSLSHIEAQQERLINDMLQCMVDLNMAKFEALLNESIQLRGIDKTITFLIFPFLDKIGILWLANHINPAQEHLVSNVIRQKLIVGIENTTSHIIVHKTVLLFLPEGEHHELGLLYVYYLLKSRGAQVIYLGANVPVRDLEFITHLKLPDYLYTHLTCMTGNSNLDKFFQQLHHKMPQVPLVISGYTKFKKMPPGILLKRSLTEVLDYVATL
ncbi:MerR family transcriptional regulator [Pseudoflavitalea sp. X16]|uniref:MerR family transcriptional regulator n=1 Tax=Paraflavitalea devenefica TaxID=2716334 RepID=UPI00141F7FA4|nr:MerR family transcriptional regulator [Paraflavitalea devenefica]NII24003.1 MerR family transcriptional regulator [Paraflavitalea devenefica]